MIEKVCKHLGSYLGKDKKNVSDLLNRIFKKSTSQTTHIRCLPEMSKKGVCIQPTATVYCHLNRTAPRKSVLQFPNF
jgi:hypothetical protein